MKKRQVTTYAKIFSKDKYHVYDDKTNKILINALLRAMSMEEKCALLGGSREPEDKGKIGNAGYIWGVPRLGVPEIVMYDGPAGVTGIVETTGLPQPSLLGCTWDEEMAYQFGTVAAAENAACSGNFQLSPQVDTIHTPHFARNKDMKGEDSFLVGKLSAAETRATQDQHVVATIKHFAVANSMGGFGTKKDNRVDEQTLHETFLQPFQRCIAEGKAGSVMNSYNMVNGYFSTDSKELNIEILRNMWGFAGCLMSDWGAVHNFTLSQGMDIEMPYPAYNHPSRIMKHLRKGTLTWEEIDEAVRHVLNAMASVGLLSLVELDENGEVKEEPGRRLPIEMEWRYEKEAEEGLLERHAAICREILQKGIVLLKNEGALPLNCEKKLALIGLGAKYPACGQQQERSYGRLERMISGAQALSEATGKRYEAFPGIDYVGEPIGSSCLYLDENCTQPGALRMKGISREAAGLARGNRGPGGMGAAFNGMVSYDEDGERVSTFGDDFFPELQLQEQDGPVVAVDKHIHFITQTANYKNGPEGNAFPDGAYTWRSFLKAPETGKYVLKLEGIGGNARFLLCKDGEWVEIAEISTRECTQWPWDSVICTSTGMGIRGKEIELEAGKVYPILIIAQHSVIHKDLQLSASWTRPSYRESNYRKALEAAKEADTILFYLVNSQENEGENSFLRGAKKEIKIYEEQLNLLRNIHKNRRPGSKLILILNTSNAVETKEWADMAEAIVLPYFGGQEGNRVIAEILTGKVNPSGKLSQSWPKDSRDTSWTDSEEHFQERMVGKQIKGIETTQMSDGIFFGYRWHDKYGVEPGFAFGHGLSYTSYKYENLSIAREGDSVAVKLDVTNTGKMEGDEIVQVYLGKGEVPPYIQIAEKQLAGYMRVKQLRPGETRSISILLDNQMLCVWDSALPLTDFSNGCKGKWRRITGKREVMVGASSRDIRLSETVEF